MSGYVFVAAGFSLRKILKHNPANCGVATTNFKL